MDIWHGLDIDPIKAFEDWARPMDNIEKDDLNPVATETRYLGDQIRLVMGIIRQNLLACALPYTLCTGIKWVNQH